MTFSHGQLVDFQACCGVIGGRKSKPFTGGTKLFQMGGECCKRQAGHAVDIEGSKISFACFSGLPPAFRGCPPHDLWRQGNRPHTSLAWVLVRSLNSKTSDHSWPTHSIRGCTNNSPQVAPWHLLLYHFKVWQTS